ncbi:hypothetical protein R1917_01380 [Citrobacter koseri]|nr:hypothetical protein [Citrobacter koseri]WOJ31078.1 hypothetical protein R1917_01380 [Citrobacter koseri]
MARWRKHYCRMAAAPYPAYELPTETDVGRASEAPPANMPDGGYALSGL